MKKHNLKSNELKKASLARLSTSSHCLLPTAYCLLLLALVGCQSREHQVSVDSLTAPLPTPKVVVDPNITDLERIKEGMPAPDFALEDINNKVYRLSDYKSQKDVVLVFYRGHF